MEAGRTDQTKRCPMCGEEILAVAIKCKHCHSMLSDNAVGEASTAPQQHSTVAAAHVSPAQTPRPPPASPPIATRTRTPPSHSQVFNWFCKGALPGFMLFGSFAMLAILRASRGSVTLYFWRNVAFGAALGVALAYIVSAIPAFAYSRLCTTPAGSPAPSTSRALAFAAVYSIVLYVGGAWALDTVVEGHLAWTSHAPALVFGVVASAGSTLYPVWRARSGNEEPERTPEDAPREW